MQNERPDSICFVTLFVLTPFVSSKETIFGANFLSYTASVAKFTCVYSANMKDLDNDGHACHFFLIGMMLIASLTAIESATSYLLRTTARISSRVLVSARL